MRSRIATGAATGLLAVLSIAAGLFAQDKPEPGQVASGTSFKDLFVFDSTNGALPGGALVQGTDGNVYGTTAAGGANNDGTVYELTPQGKLTILHSFDGTDGNGPIAVLALGSDGNFYGTSYEGGGHANVCSYGCGTVFKITPAGTLTTLYRFCAQAGCSDGDRPSALVQGSDGNFYGTTEFDGSTACVNGCGTVFRITPSGAFTTLLSFDGTGGYSPSAYGGLLLGTDGNFYGTTVFGGSSTACSGGCGTVFKITPKGVLTTLHSFVGTGTEGSGPQGAMTQATDGNFYGTTLLGGSSTTCGVYGCGTVFEITPQGRLTTLTSLNYTDGWNPWDELVQATDGNFYGTGRFGGSSNKCPNNCGTVFKVTPEGLLSVLHSFGSTDGAYPQAGLLQATNGIFYGLAYEGGTYGDGTISRLALGLGPFIKSVPTAGKVGATVNILGNNLLFATGVTFNGAAATFTAESSTYIKASVPTGATTGPVQVTLPNGTLTSNVNFQVMP